MWFKTSSPRRRTERQQQPSGYVAQSQERLRSERADSRPGARTPDGDSKRLLTSLGFDRNGLALLPLPKASITGSLYPLSGGDAENTNGGGRSASTQAVFRHGSMLGLQQQD